MLATTPSAKVELAAGTDPDRKTALVLLGAVKDFSGPVLIRLTNLDRAPYLINDVSLPVFLEMIPDGAAPLDAPIIVFNYTLKPANGTLEIPINWETSRNAYALRLGPGR